MALQVNNLNEERKTRVQEKNVLLALHNEISNNLTSLETSLKEILFIWASGIITSIFVVNVLLKNTWGRARPNDILQFGGTNNFTPWYKFSEECVLELVKKFPNQIVGVKDSSYNLFENLKLKNFSIFPGSELKLLKGLELGCSGIITATCNVTAAISRKVYDDFYSGKKQTVNQKLCDVREAFDKYNLISGLHSYCSKENEVYKNILPPLSLLNTKTLKLETLMQQALLYQHLYTHQLNWKLVHYN